MSISERIRLVLDRKKIPDQDLAQMLDLTPQRISQKFKENKWTIIEVQDIAETTGYRFEWLATGNGAETEEVVDVAEPPTEYLTGKTVRPITVTVDRHGVELISYVPVKAQAGYMRGFGDARYLEKLPAFSLPNFNDKGTHRMFQVDGDSMLQLGGGGLHDGDIVIAQYVEDIFSLRDNRVYVVVSTEGLVVKRVINRLTTSDKVLVLKSDNKSGAYPDKLLHPHEILEVWELKAFISRQLGFSTDLWEIINDLQVKQAILAERLDRVEGPRKRIE